MNLLKLDDAMLVAFAYEHREGTREAIEDSGAAYPEVVGPVCEALRDMYIDPRARSRDMTLGQVTREALKVALRGGHLDKCALILCALADLTDEARGR